MSEEILAQESEETAEEEIVEPSEQDSSDDLTEEEVEEGKTAKASVKKEQDDEEEDEEDEEPTEEKKVKKEAVSIPKTKNQMLKNIYDTVNGMLKGDLSTKYEEIMAATNLEIVKEEDKEVRTKVAVKVEDIKIDVKDDVEALIQGEEGLTEDFKQKASTIFEAAVQAKVVEQVNSKME